jgi:hypothetical protein
MIEKIILKYLDQELSVPVYMERPKSPPQSYVLIEKTGSGLSDHIYSCTLALQSYAPKLVKAAELNEEVKTAMLNCTSLAEICQSHLNSDYNFTDPTTKEYRYQAVFDIKHY